MKIKCVHKRIFNSILSLSFERYTNSTAKKFGLSCGRDNEYGVSSINLRIWDMAIVILLEDIEKIEENYCWICEKELFSLNDAIKK